MAELAELIKLFILRAGPDAETGVGYNYVSASIREADIERANRTDVRGNLLQNVFSRATDVVRRLEALCLRAGDTTKNIYHSNCLRYLIRA